MPQEEQIIDLAEKLVFDGLETADEKLVEDEILSDSDKKALFEYHVALNLAFQQEANARKKASFQDILETIEPEFEETQTRNLRPLYIGLAIAAAIAVLLAIFLPAGKSTINSAELFATNYEPYYPDNLRSGTKPSKVDSLIQRANLLSRADQCEEAIKTYQDILENEPEGVVGKVDDIMLYQASCQLKLKQFDEAYTLLEQIKGGDRETVDWYKGLAKLGLNQIEEAAAIFGKIAKDSNSSYRNKAADLAALLAS